MRKKESLQIEYPEIAKEWHPTKNGDLKPTDVTAGSEKKVWWICEKGHEWEASVSNRRKAGCPICSGRKVLAGYNDLATTNPEIAAQWHPSKNGDLASTDVSRKETGCPYCSGRRVLPGLNDLATTNPELLLEWHPTKNGSLKPSDISKGSTDIVWWVCSKGHEWQDTPNSRTYAHTGCPYCSGKRVLQGFNDLATTYPEIAAEWHPTKNGDLKPTDVTDGSGKTIWWICSKGHEWQSHIYNRKKAGCPYCSNKSILIGFNDLATTNPELAAQWHPTKNGNPFGDIVPSMASALACAASIPRRS